MKALLLADANRLSASASKYEATRQKIDAAAYETFMLSETDFYEHPELTNTSATWCRCGR